MGRGRRLIHPLIEDIYKVVSEGCEVSEEQADKFGKDLGALIAQHLRDRGKERPFTLRMSNIGKGARQLWYESKHGSGEDLPPHTIIKFMYGDIIEALVLFLADLAGHDVTAHQDEVVVNGIKGHIDADIDGVTVDVKSASTYSFKKFADGTLADNDSFGYVDQLAGYCTARSTDGAFIAVDKQNGHLAYLAFDLDDLLSVDIPTRIDYLKAALDSPIEPERCYEDEADGASGNRKLSVNCSYCSHKFRCWADSNNGQGLRTFIYSTGPRYLTNVAVEPRVTEKTEYERRQ